MTIFLSHLREGISQGAERKILLVKSNLTFPHTSKPELGLKSLTFYDPFINGSHRYLKSKHVMGLDRINVWKVVSASSSDSPWSPQRLHISNQQTMCC